MKVKFVCPTCKNSKEITIPQYSTVHLITVSIPKGMICDHHFQAFIDKNYSVRGYQKVDIDLKEQVIESKLETQKNDQEFHEVDREDLEPNAKKILSLKEMYDEFWEFIDTDNILFADLIKNDGRRILIETRNENMKIKEFISNLENDIVSHSS
ncbi:MAG: hypothetical protein ACFFBH_13635 [Promethearchaeota archaeon]